MYLFRKSLLVLLRIMDSILVRPYNYLYVFIYIVVLIKCTTPDSPARKFKLVWHCDKYGQARPKRGNGLDGLQRCV